MKYARDTTVAVGKTRAELEDLLQRYGATSTAVFNAPGETAIAFEMQGRRVLLKLPLPRPEDREIVFATFGARGRRARTDAQIRATLDKVSRQRWRALLLAVKAKLVAIEERVETFEEAFMAHVVMPDGSRVADHVSPRIADKGAEIEIERENPRDQFYIRVRYRDGGYLYDGWASEDVRTVAEAKREARRGACLDK